MITCHDAAGWALCGHETPAGEAEQPDGQGIDQPADGQEADIQGTGSAGQLPHHAQAAATISDSQGVDSTEPLSHNTHAAVCTSDNVVVGNGSVCEQDADTAQAQQTVLLSRPERIALGSNCKKLIDKGRELWLAEQGFQVHLHWLGHTLH